MQVNQLTLNEVLHFFFFIVDDLHKVFKDANTKYVVTVPALVPNVMAAKQGLRDIKVTYSKTSTTIFKN